MFDFSAGLDNIEFTPFVQYHILQTKKVSDAKPDNGSIVSNDDVNGLLVDYARDPQMQYIIVKKMWQTDVHENRLLREYVLSRKNGALTGNPDSPIDLSKVKENKPRSLGPQPRESRNTAPVVTDGTSNEHYTNESDLFSNL